jgi:hypothetical protein
MTVLELNTLNTSTPAIARRNVRWAIEHLDVSIQRRRPQHEIERRSLRQPRPALGAKVEGRLTVVSTAALGLTRHRNHGPELLRELNELCRRLPASGRLLCDCGIRGRDACYQQDTDS